MKKYPYLLYINTEHTFNEKALAILEQVQEVHILAPYVKDFSLIKHTNVTVYVFNETQYAQCIKNNWNFHIALYGNNIFNDELLQYIKEDTEVFWFPHSQQISDNISLFTVRLNVLKMAVCINYNPYLQDNILPEQFRLFVKSIHKEFNNPLFNKEKQLLMNAPDNTYDIHSLSNNMTIVQQKNMFTLSPVVLGVYGDLPILDSNASIINKKAILKNKECQWCDFNEQCINRNLGYIMDTLNYKGCISIKLMQP